MGNTGANRDLKEQAHRHCRAHGTAKTPAAAFELLEVQLQCRRSRPGKTRSCFSSKGAGGPCHPLPPLPPQLPSPAQPQPMPLQRGSDAARVAGHGPETQSLRWTRARGAAGKAAPTARGWDAGLCAMPCPEQTGDALPRTGDALPCPEQDHRPKLGDFFFMANRSFAQSLPGGANGFKDSQPLQN